MSHDINDSDWHLLQQLHPVVLDRFCRRALAEAARICGDETQSPDERFTTLSDLMKRRHEDLGAAIHRPLHSTALLQLVHMHSHGLLTPEEFARFSAETRSAVELRLGSGA